MTKTKSARLYRIVREHCYNGGRGSEQVNDREVLYCGYDRLEAMRVYHGNFGVGSDTPGHYFSRIVAKSKEIHVS